MSKQEFWVVGGRYSNTRFTELEEGTRAVEGPFASYEDAESVWKKTTQAHRTDACARFTIVACAPNPRRKAA